MKNNLYHDAPFRSLKEVTAPRFHCSLGALVDVRDCKPSVIYRAPTLAEKREAFRAVVAFNMRRGNAGQVRFKAAEAAAIRVVAYAKRGCYSVTRENFRMEYATFRDVYAVA